MVAAGASMPDSLCGGAVGLVGNALASGMVVTGMVYSTGHISGAHLNPAVTLGFTLTRHLQPRQACLYIAVQVIAAVLAASALRLVLGHVYGMGGHAPSGGALQSFGLEVFLTFFLMFVIMAVATDKRTVGHGAAVAIGAIVAAAIIFAGPISGGSMNPARSFGPALIGWPWGRPWIYWAGPVIGATLGAISYQWLYTTGRKGMAQ